MNLDWGSDGLEIDEDALTGLHVSGNGNSGFASQACGNSASASVGLHFHELGSALQAENSVCKSDASSQCMDVRRLSDPRFTAFEFRCDKRRTPAASETQTLLNDRRTDALMNKVVVQEGSDSKGTACLSGADSASQSNSSVLPSGEQPEASKSGTWGHGLTSPGEGGLTRVEPIRGVQPTIRGGLPRNVLQDVRASQDLRPSQDLGESASFRSRSGSPTSVCSRLKQRGKPPRHNPRSQDPNRGALALPALAVKGWTLAEDIDPEPSRDDEEVLISRCRQEGPPGPASAALAVPGFQVPGHAGSTSAPCMIFAESVAWLCALQEIGLPFDRFHLGAGPDTSQSGSPMCTHNLAAVMQSPWPPRRWHLVVLVRRVEAIAGEITVRVSDPTGEARATLDQRILRLWPEAANEGSVLLLANVVAVPMPAAAASEQVRHSNAAHESVVPQLLIMVRSLGKCFVPGDAHPEEVAHLLARAKRGLSGS